MTYFEKGNYKSEILIIKMIKKTNNVNLLI